MEKCDTIKLDNVFIVGDSSKINEENQRFMTFEEVQSLFEGYFYQEVNISNGFNIDTLSDIVHERLYKDAK